MSTSHEPRAKLELHLRDIRDLFVAPDMDPFDPYFTDWSIVDTLVNELTPLRRKRRPQITVYLPADQITPTLAADTQAALDRYLELRARRAHNDVLSMRRGGIQALWYALGLTLIVAVPMVLAYVLSWSTLVQDLSYAAFLVVGWVAMWCAVEYILFDWLQNARLSKVLKDIRSGDWQFLPEPATKP